MRFAGERLRLSASDVANFVACQHMTRLDLLEARGSAAPDAGVRPRVRGPGASAARRTSGSCWSSSVRTAAIVEINPSPGAEAEAAQATREAIHGGADVIYQGVLLGASPDARRDGAAGAAGLPGPRRPARSPGWGAAPGRAALRGRGRQAGPDAPRRARSRRPRSTPTSSPRCRASGPAGCTWRSAGASWSR